MQVLHRLGDNLKDFNLSTILLKNSAVIIVFCSALTPGSFLLFTFFIASINSLTFSAYKNGRVSAGIEVELSVAPLFNDPYLEAAETQLSQALKSSLGNFEIITSSFAKVLLKVDDKDNPLSVAPSP